MVEMETSNSLMAAFSDTVSSGFVALQGPVNGVFGLMIALVVALTGLQWALSPNRELLAIGFGKVLLIGAFAFLINDWQSLCETVQAGFIELGLEAGGGGLSRAEFLNPGAILEAGWQIVRALGETSAPAHNPLDVAGNLTDAFILGLAMIGVMLAFAVLALQIIVTLLEFKIVTLGGFVLLPFGIWSKSAFLAERPLGYVAASGLKVLALAIVVSGARTIFDQLQPSANPDLYEALAILAAAVLLAMLAILIPSLAAALVTGGPALGAGGALTGALATGGGALLLGAAAGGLARTSTGAAAAMRAAAGAAGAGARPGPPPLAGSSVQRPVGPNLPGAGASARPAASGPGMDRPAPGPPISSINAQASQTRPDVTPPVQAPNSAGSPPAERRRLALQSFFAANAARSLAPAAESTGPLTPQLRSEEP
jgi:type IV secretion system protein TrbL